MFEINWEVICNLLEKMFLITKIRYFSFLTTKNQMRVHSAWLQLPLVLNNNEQLFLFLITTLK